MLRILGFNRPQTTGGSGTQLIVESDEFMPDTPDVDIRYLMPDGQLETYLEHYGFPPGASLVAILIDAFYEDVEMPHWSDPAADERFKAIVDMEKDRIEWQCDKNELLATVTVAEDDPESLASTWIAIKAGLAEKAKGWERLQEERMADDFVTVMPTAVRAQPRDVSTQDSSPSVGLGITFVP